MREARLRETSKPILLERKPRRDARSATGNTMNDSGAAASIAPALIHHQRNGGRGSGGVARGRAIFIGARQGESVRVFRSDFATRVVGVVGAARTASRHQEYAACYRDQ